MIKSIKLQPLRNGDYIQFLTDTLKIISDNNPVELNISAQYNDLLQATNNTEALFKTTRGSRVTRTLEALDQRRDNAINGINLLTQGYAYSTDATVSKHAKTLTAHLTLFGSRIAKENYQSETTILRVIVNDWKCKPELQAAVSHLNLGSWLAELEQANHDFSEAYSKRNEELAIAPTSKLIDMRNAANELYYKLRTRLIANFEINDGAAPWATTINLLNQNIDNYNIMQSRHRPQNDEG